MLQPTTIKSKKKKIKEEEIQLNGNPEFKIDIHGFNSHNNNNPCNFRVSGYYEMVEKKKIPTSSRYHV